MKVYVRLSPLCRPIPIDAEPTTTVKEVRERVGAEALFKQTWNTKKCHKQICKTTRQTELA